MLTASTHKRISKRAGQQNGIVLFITLIVLVAMTLAGIAMVRSVSTTTIIAGNLAFQQGATHAGDTGIESAVAWLEQNNSGTTLHNNTGMGYLASRQDPTAGQSWDDFWNAQLSGQAVTLSQDAAGNTASYVIQRLCASIGSPNDPSPQGCAVSPSSSSTGSSKSADYETLQYNSQIYYRITTRIAGPRNTVSYVQAIVAM